MAPLSPWTTNRDVERRPACARLHARLRRVRAACETARLANAARPAPSASRRPARPVLRRRRFEHRDQLRLYLGLDSRSTCPRRGRAGRLCSGCAERVLVEHALDVRRTPAGDGRSCATAPCKGAGAGASALLVLRAARTPAWPSNTRIRRRGRSSSQQQPSSRIAYWSFARSGGPADATTAG